jgi:hypothetical protein
MLGKCFMAFWGRLFCADKAKEMIKKESMKTSLNICSEDYNITGNPQDFCAGRAISICIGSRAILRYNFNIARPARK